MPKTPIPLPPELEGPAAAVLEEQAAAAAEAASAPVDGTLRVGPLVFREVTFGDVEALRLLGSPYHGRFVACPDVVEPDFGALLDVVFLWTRPSAVGLCLARKGADAFRQASSSAANLVDAPVSVAGEMSTAVEENIRRALHG